jgi:hypothetical protein
MIVPSKNSDCSRLAAGLKLFRGKKVLRGEQSYSNFAVIDNPAPAFSPSRTAIQLAESWLGINSGRSERRSAGLVAFVACVF